MRLERITTRLHLAVLAICVLTLGSSASAQDVPQSSEQLIQQGVRLHDSGDYAGAIAIYKRILAAEPDNTHARYEMTYSTYASGDIAEALRLATAGVKIAGPLQAAYYEILGNALDGLHRNREAIDAYKRGIRVNPALPTLHFNLGLAYIGANKPRDARLALERAIEVNGNYASAHYALAELYRAQGYRVPAVLAYGRFLSLSPTGERATQAATQLRALLTVGVKREDATHITLTVPSPSKSKTEVGDFGGLEMMMAIAGGAEHLSEKASASEFERQSDTYSTFLAMLTEAPDQISAGFIKKVYLPFYMRMSAENQKAAFVGLAVAPLKAAGSTEWLAAHETEIAQFLAWAKK